MLRAVINKQASEDDVSKAAVEVEKYVEKNETAKRELGRITTTVVNSGKFSNYGTEAARKKLKEWEKKFGAKTTERKKSNVKKASEKKPADKQATEKKGE